MIVTENTKQVNKCKCPWSMQAGCRYTAADGIPNETKDTSKMSNCWAKDGTCEYQVKGDS